MTRKTQILVVEDENIVAKDIHHRLQALGYGVPGMVSSGEEALEKAGEMLPDLVLMDIRLKGRMDGVETAEEVRRRFDIPVVFLTAYADNHTLQRAKVSAPFGYILKPFGERELHTCIEVALSKHQMESKLKESEQWLSTTLRCIGDAVMASDAQGDVKFLNHVAETLTGWTQCETVTRPLLDIFRILPDDARLCAERFLEKALRAGEGADEFTCRRTTCSYSPTRVGQGDLLDEAFLIAKDGTTLPIEYRVSAIRGDGGQTVGVVLVFRDITERKQTEEKLKYLSTHDILTGLHNRAYFEEEMERLGHGRHFPVSVIMADIDDLKTLNDTYGHATGDKMLRDAARLLKSAFRGEDVVTRIGGDEFAVLLPNTDAVAAAEAMVRIQQGVTAFNAAHPEHPLRLSLGAATAMAGCLDEAQKEADQRMYQAKLRNRSRRP